MLLERDDALRELAARRDEAVGGDGRLVLLGGDAGSGKTTLVTAFARRAGALRVLRGSCDDLTTPAPLGPVLEVLPDLAHDGSAGPELFTRARRELGRIPTLLVLEDLHWADAATCDLLRFVGRRLAGLPLVVLATFRDEPRADTALTRLLGTLATAPGVSRLGVEALSPAAVAELVSAAGSDLDPMTLHERTGGNPFYVTEVLARPGRELPETVRDAVLARVAVLPPEAREVLAAAAVLGQASDLRLLARVSGSPDRAVDRCVAAGLLVGGPQGWDFRHALARLAVAGTQLPARTAALHAAALAALRERGVDDDRRLAHHAEGCGDRAAVGHHAALAATRAARLGAHAQAVPLLQAALGSASDDHARARLSAELSYECYLTGRLQEAREARLTTLALAPDDAAAGDALRWLSRLSWYLGDNDDAARYADRAVATLEPHGPSRALAMAYSDHTDAAISWGDRALAMARQVGDVETETHALNNVGAAHVQAGRRLEGTTLLRRSLDLALAADAHEHAARAYTNLGSGSAKEREYEAAAGHLEAGIDYCAARDLDSWEHYMSAWLARVLAEQGRLHEAAALADRVLAAPDLAPVSRIPALAVCGTVAARTGDTVTAETALRSAAALAHGTHEAQRLVPVAAARAEAAWLAGERSVIPGLLAEARRAAEATHDPWDLGELAWWYAAAGAPQPAVQPVAEVYGHMLGHRWQQAAETWEALGCPVQAALCRAYDPALEVARAGLDRLRALGVEPVRVAVLRDRTAAGLPVPRGPRAATAAGPAGLTAREVEVLALLVEGLSDAEIAAALVLSPKTVGHHVSKVLAKLGEPTRSRAAAAAVRDGLVANMGSPTDVGAT